jgi:hypothetical protein
VVEAAIKVRFFMVGVLSKNGMAAKPFNVRHRSGLLVCKSRLC